MLSPTLALVSVRAPLQSSPIPAPAVARPFILRYTIDGVRCENAYALEDERDAAACDFLVRGYTCAITCVRSSV